MFLSTRQPIADIAKVFLESSEPRGNGGQHTSKVIVVAFLPKAPSSSEEYFHDHFPGVLRLQVLQQMQPIPVCGPRYIQQAPTFLTEGTMKEEMLHRFFNVLPAKKTIKVVTNIVVVPFEHVPRVEPVREQKPTKDFDFWYAFSLPEPLECHVCNHITENKLIVHCGFEHSRSPTI